MDTELLLQNLEVLNLILLFFGICAALKATTKISSFGHPHHETDKIKKKVFPLLCWGMIFLFGGNWIRNMTRMFWGSDLLVMFSFIGIWISYALFIAAFGYFWYATKEMHHISTRERWFFAGMVGLVIIWNAYLFQAIIPTLSLTTTFGKIALIINPTLISVMFILTFAVHPRIKAGVVDSSLGYISSGVFVYFVGFILIQHTSETVIPVIVLGILILISSAYYWLGFVVARKKVLKIQRTLLQVPTIEQEISKISRDINRLNGKVISHKQPSRTTRSNRRYKK